MTFTNGCAVCGRSAGMSTPACPSCPDAPDRPAVPVLLPAGPLTPATSRWSASATTFGPVGRVVATVAMLLPVPVFVVTAGLGFGLVGAGIWLGVLLPWGLRDIWRPARRR